MHYGANSGPFLCIASSKDVRRVRETGVLFEAAVLAAFTVARKVRGDA